MDQTERETADMIAENMKRNVDGLTMKIAERNFYSAYEELYVLEKKVRAAMATDPVDMTEERLELIGRLAWAEVELMQGYADRQPDDLDGVEDLAETVRDQ